MVVVLPYQRLAQTDRQRNFHTERHRARRGRSAGEAFGIEGCDEFNQGAPRNDFVHLFQEPGFAGFPDGLLQVKGGLFLGEFSQTRLTPSTQAKELCRVYLGFFGNDYFFTTTSEALEYILV